MANFTLTTCRFREGWLVPFRGSETVELDWPGLCARLAPGAPPSALRTLRFLTPNTYIGLMRVAEGQYTNFIVRNPDMSGDARVLARKDPNFADAILAVYRVDRVEWDDRMIEADHPKSLAS